ncbi:MAG: hypothetical protein AAGC81_01825 [Pseudomonadota bacterium]
MTKDLTRHFTPEERAEYEGVRIFPRDIRKKAGHCIRPHKPGGECLEKWLADHKICTLREAIGNGISATDMIDKGDALGWRAVRLVGNGQK